MEGNRLILCWNTCALVNRSAEIYCLDRVGRHAHLETDSGSMVVFLIAQL